MTHYYVHHRRPRGPVGRKLRELHMRHHFQDHTRGFGVSAPWWDVVFRTPTERAARAVSDAQPEHPRIAVIGTGYELASAFPEAAVA